MGADMADDDRDDAPAEATPPRRLGRFWWVAGLAIAALVVIVLAPLASTDPDGLARVAEDNGFLDQAQTTLSAVIPNYTVPGLGGSLSTVIAGLIGIAVVVGLMLLLGRVLARRRS
jgi:cobalt/nickel transport system permease protein